MPTFHYTLHHSQKAKYLQLRFSARGLEVIVPVKRRVSQATIEQFLQDKKAWIMRHSQRWLQIQEKHDVLPVQLPSHIPLLAIEQTWEVVYLAATTSRLKCISNQDRQIKLVGDVNNHAQCVRLLQQWLKKMAQNYLSEQLYLLSVEHHLPFSQLSFRHNSSRWGSCSSDKNISLCCNLLFLPPRLVRHVLLHELCHTKVMTHGTRFWQLLGKLDHDCDVHRKELKQAGRYVPRWIMPPSVFNSPACPIHFA